MSGNRNATMLAGGDWQPGEAATLVCGPIDLYIADEKDAQFSGTAGLVECVGTETIITIGIPGGTEICAALPGRITPAVAPRRARSIGHARRTGRVGLFHSPEATTPR